jgi:hypothetical protein
MTPIFYANIPKCSDLDRRLFSLLFIIAVHLLGYSYAHPFNKEPFVTRRENLRIAAGEAETD